MSNVFTPESLTQAVKQLFKLNNYEVTGPLHIHGAEVDLMAKSLMDPLAGKIYIEVTIEYVNNVKYGKDATKFLLIRNKEPRSQLLLISSKGFTVDVKERAIESGIELFTYEELFNKFQRFSSYISKVLEEGEIAKELDSLTSIYEKAYFDDEIGQHIAIDFLTNWLITNNPSNPWIVVTGDYGTGKTALTKVLLRKWTELHHQNAEFPMPFRLELRDFTKQFSARGLIHHFLDSYDLHIPLNFVMDLIRKGKIVLLLDGYDEMAQFMNVRERRECLKALAELSKDGAKGILTSRPNYFTVNEELNLLNAFYDQLNEEKGAVIVGLKALNEIEEKERGYDALLKQFLDRYERFLKDLNEEQTRNLIRRILKGDEIGQAIILTILNRIFKTTDLGTEVSLSGKPVIISYLLEVINEIKLDPTINSQEILNEWTIFQLILRNLMFRDYNRSQLITTDERRKFLRFLSISSSVSANNTITENDFKNLVNLFFHYRLERLTQEEKSQLKDDLFSDVRSSSTLTRRSNSNVWQFSHNSLREFLVTEYLMYKLRDGDYKLHHNIRPNDAMRAFASAASIQLIENLIEAQKSYYENHVDKEVISLYFELLWDAAMQFFSNQPDPVSTYFMFITKGSKNLKGFTFNRIKFAFQNRRHELDNFVFVETVISDSEFKNCCLDGSSFTNSIIQGVSFIGCSLKNTNFNDTEIEQVEINDCDVTGADFSKANFTRLIFEGKLYDGKDALGVLAYHKAIVRELPQIFILKFHPYFPIAEKIANKFLEQPVRQELGLTKKGIDGNNRQVARRFLDILKANGYVRKIASRDTVELTPSGRSALSDLVQFKEIPSSITKFFE